MDANVLEQLQAIIAELQKPARDARDMPRRVELCQRALELLPRQGNEQPWAALQSKLANSFAQNPLDNRADNLEQAIHHYQQALEVYTRHQFPDPWAATQNNLANAYKNRIRGDRADNLEQAIHHYQQALEVYTRHQFPDPWATTMMNLANAYKNRIREDRAHNIERAIHAYQQALTVRTQSAMPVDWAECMMNLAIAYYSRIRGDRAHNIEQAIHAYQQALTVRTQSAMPVDWAQTINNLAAAYSNRIRGDRAQNIEQAIHAYQQALTIMTQSAMPVAWATTMMNLANAYTNRIRGDRAQNIEQAIHAYQQALTVTTQSALPNYNRQTLSNLGILYFDESRWVEAVETYQQAIETSKDLFATSHSDTGRQQALSESTQSYTRAAYSLLKTGQIGGALATLESGKARLLAESAAAQSAQLDLLTDEQQKQLNDLQNEIRSLEAQYRLPTDNPARRDERDLSDALRDTRARLRDLIAAFREQHPDFMPVGLPLDDLLANIPAGCALIAPLFTSKGSAVFVVPGGAETVTDDHLLWLDDLTTDDLNALVVGSEDDPGWLRGYLASRGSGVVLSVINDIGAKLWEKLVGRLHAQLASLGVRRLLVMPPGMLGLLPIHAAWREVDGERRYLCDKYQISYTPSMFALASARRRAGQQHGRQALVAGVSQYNQLSNLPNTAIEARTIAALFNAEALVDNAVTQDAVISGVKGTNILHMACHGSAAWGNDWHDAALYLHNDKPLRLSEIIGKLELDHTRLVVLSACETGITDWRNVPDEFLGLPIGFMQAGAGAVVSSLWTVEDHSTALLMERFYEFYLDESEPRTASAALREAQDWLRTVKVKDLVGHYETYLRMTTSEAQTAVMKLKQRKLKPEDTPYSHPFYWAAFKLDGL